MTLTIRDATRSDLEQVMALIVAGNVPGTAPTDDPSEAQTAPYLAAFEAISADPNHRLLVAERDGELVGTLQISYVPGLIRRGMWRAILESVHVRPDQRRQGTGGAMVRHAIDLARQRGCGLVQLTSSKARTDAHRFYRNLGFEQGHEGFKLTL